MVRVRATGHGHRWTTTWFGFSGSDVWKNRARAVGQHCALAGTSCSRQKFEIFFKNFIHINIVNTNFTALLLLCLQACQTNNLSIFHFI